MRLVSAHPFYFSFFKHPQKFRLHRQRHIANLIQKQRAAFCLLELSKMLGRRSRERALSCPNSADSISSAGTAAQFKVTNAFSACADFS